MQLAADGTIGTVVKVDTVKVAPMAAMARLQATIATPTHTRTTGAVAVPTPGTNTVMGT